MNRKQLRETRNRLTNFLKQIMPLVGRRDRQHWGEVYIRGLLTEGGRKTAASIGQRLPDGNVQALQQFVGQSPWHNEPVRQKLAQTLIKAMSPKPIWIIDDTGFPKKGTNSVGVARQYSGTLGKTGNCQVAVSINYASDQACIPLDFTLYLPEEWFGDQQRLKKAGVPEEVTFKPKWELALKMVDRIRTWEVPEGIVCADAGYGRVTKFRKALDKRHLQYVVGIDNTAGAWKEAANLSQPKYQGTGRPRKRPKNIPKPQSVAEIARNLPESAWQIICWRQGAKGKLESRFACLRVQPSHSYYNRNEESEEILWLLIEWPQKESEPTKYWFSNLPADTSLKELVYIAKSRWWIEQNYQQLKDELGLDHYEGRSWLGWNHHVTLTMIAFGFLTLEMLRGKKNYWVDHTADPPGNTGYSSHMDGSMHDMWPVDIKKTT
jgi:SRSO17 transposase